MIEPVVIGLGGNIGTFDEILERFGRARAALAVLGGVRSAPLYRSAPVIPAGEDPRPAGRAVGVPTLRNSASPIGQTQAEFLNTAVCLALADGQPAELIATLLELERMLGRTRAHEARWGPRRIDLDVLVWGDRIVRTPELWVPHPRLAERKFALAPLVALLGDDFVIPGLDPGLGPGLGPSLGPSLGTAGELLSRVAAQACDELAATW